MEFITLTHAFTVLPSNGTQSLFHTKWAITPQEVLQIPSGIRWFSAYFHWVFAAVEPEPNWSWVTGAPFDWLLITSCYDSNQSMWLGCGEIKFKALSLPGGVSAIALLCNAFLDYVYQISSREICNRAAIGQQREQELMAQQDQPPWPRCPPAWYGKWEKLNVLLLKFGFQHSSAGGMQKGGKGKWAILTLCRSPA